MITGAGTRSGALPALALTLALALTACDDGPVHAPIGEPLPGLTDDELTRFTLGLAEFNRIFTPEEGLGPLFNENQCSACHTDPAVGGTGEQFLVRAVRRDDAAGTCEPFIAAGGDNVRQRATPALEAHGIRREEVRADATHTGRFIVPFLFGLGMVEAVPEEDLLARADPDDRDGDGISGRPGRDAHGNFARFGHKGEFASIEAFTTGALHMEMGLTTAAHPHDGFGAMTLPDGVSFVDDPEVDDATVQRLVDFVRFLAPPAPRIPADPADQERVERGRHAFQQIGCAECHVPRLRTGRSDVAALDRRDFLIYSDFLLHDLGANFADVCGIAAGPSELRTAPLAGLGRRRMLLHDGRALSIEDAILMHGGEAVRARENFRALPIDVQQALLRFLATL